MKQDIMRHHRQYHFFLQEMPYCASACVGLYCKNTWPLASIKFKLPTTWFSRTFSSVYQLPLPIQEYHTPLKAEVVKVSL